MLKIIAGEFRSRRLLSPEDARVTRPYAARVKESIFNLLRGWFEGARVLDLFAGVGTVGLEAVSRGAAHVFMVERDREVFRLLQRNIENLGCGDRVTAIQADALSPVTLARITRPIDLVFIDPPYQMMEHEQTRRRVLDQASRCRSLMGDRGFLVLRSPIGADEVDLKIEGFDGPESHKYSADMYVLLYAPKAERAAGDDEAQANEGRGQ